MAKRIIAFISLLSLIAVTLCGCSSDDLLKFFSIDPDEADPATIMVGETMNKITEKESYTDGDFEYILYKDKTAAVKAYNGQNPEVIIPDEVNGFKIVAIENKAFYKNEVMKELVISDNVEVIGNFAAMYCNTLEKLTVGKNVRLIGVSAFQPESKKAYEGKGSLRTITWLGAPELIEEKAFYFCDRLSEIVLPEGVKEIGEWAFAKCSSAERIILPDGLRKIGEYSFIKAIGAKTIVIPGTCKAIAHSAFYHAVRLQNLTLGEGIVSIEKAAFEDCAMLKEVTLPATVESIGHLAFYNCPALHTVKISSGTKAIDREAFKESENVSIVRY